MVVMVHTGGRRRGTGGLRRPEVRLGVDVTVGVHVVAHVVAVEGVGRAEPCPLGPHPVTLEGLHHVAHHSRQSQARSGQTPAFFLFRFRRQFSIPRLDPLLFHRQWPVDLQKKIDLTKSFVKYIIQEYH